MNAFSPVGHRNRLPSLLLPIFVLVMAALLVCCRSIGSSESIYFVIKPPLTKELLTRIADRLKNEHITVTYQRLDFDADKLTSIRVRIDVAIPGKPKSTYTLTEPIRPGSFEPLIFYYVPDKERVGLVRGASDELTAREKRLANENLAGLLIEGGNKREIIGNWQSN